ncbi:MAG TPA: hypothetical protein VKX96_17470 [Chloroflexota bacterium]|nr:hypothetical protein [Chloroflexota bacterium]
MVFQDRTRAGVSAANSGYVRVQNWGFTKRITDFPPAMTIAWNFPTMSLS